MTASHRFQVGANEIYLTTLRGEVLSYHKHSKTHVSGSGGSNNQPVSIHSSTNTHTEVFVRDEQGREHQVDMLNEHQVALREGHDISLVKAVLPDGGYYWVYLINHNTGNESLLNHRKGSYKNGQLWLYLLLGGVFTYLKWIQGWQSWGWTLAAAVFLTLALATVIIGLVLRPIALRRLDREIIDYLNNLPTPAQSALETRQ